MIPTSGKAEVHLVYGCNLACKNCNRISFLHEPHTPDMTVDDMTSFLNQARELDWYPAILLIGGEPTLHPDFYELCRLSREFADEGLKRGLGYEGREGLVQLWSNQLTQESRDLCAKVRSELSISVNDETAKTRSLVLSIDDIYVSPLDFGLGTRPHCWNHSSEICGISVDAAGYSPCAIGGAVDGILGLGFRTKRLADLFDEEKVQAITREMCGHCGNAISTIGLPNCTIEDWRGLVESCEKWHGMRVSPTWKKAYEGRK